MTAVFQSLLKIAKDPMRLSLYQWATPEYDSNRRATGA
jgi:hypothetical protein